MPVDMAPDIRYLGSEGERCSGDLEGWTRWVAESSEPDAAGDRYACDAGGSDNAGFP